LAFAKRLTETGDAQWRRPFRFSFVIGHFSFVIAGRLHHPMRNDK
jgi:hypothetical protein